MCVMFLHMLVAPWWIMFRKLILLEFLKPIFEAVNDIFQEGSYYCYYGILKEKGFLPEIVFTNFTPCPPNLC